MSKLNELLTRAGQAMIAHPKSTVGGAIGLGAGAGLATHHFSKDEEPTLMDELERYRNPLMAAIAGGSLGWKAHEKKEQIGAKAKDIASRFGKGLHAAFADDDDYLDMIKKHVKRK